MSSERICHACHGSKKCPTCKGTGISDERECSMCDGTGKCESCKPRGWFSFSDKDSEGVIFLPK